MRTLRPAACLLALGLSGPVTAVESVALAGRMGQQALLVIDGKPPRTLAVGASIEGVTLVSVTGAEAVVEFGGQRRTLVLGASPLNVAPRGAAAGSRRIVLTADSGGHFFGDGTINGRTVRFLVDTGATFIVMDQEHAKRLGLRLPQAPRLTMQTANGTVPVHRVSLDSVRLGGVELHQVEAVVMPQSLPVVLLGNSFLARFKLQRENDQLTLERSY